MIIHLINYSGICNMLLIDIRFFIILHMVYILLILLLFRHLRRKNLYKLVPTTDSKSKLESLNKELEPAGFGYNMKHDSFYSLMNCWQRDMGYCRLYDEAATPLSMIIDCEPIRFEYGEKKWLIEFWKGQYGMTTGAEIGVYSTTDSDLDIPELFHDTFYKSVADEERLVMSFSLLKDNKLLLYREGLHWWLTGFKLAEFSNPKSLVMEIRISFPNTMMRDAFLNSLYKVGYSNQDVIIKNQTVYIIFDRPYSKQPTTRTKISQVLIQNSNEFYCKAYKYFTRDYNNTLDKLEYLRIFSPSMYRRVFSMGKSKEIYKDFYKIKSYSDKSLEPENKD